MDNFFELLPFIIGIAYFLFSGRKKKKDSPKRSYESPKTDTSTPSIEDILRELTGEKPSQKAIKPDIPAYEDVEREEMIWERKPTPKIKVEVDDTYVDPYEHHSDTGKSLNLIREELEEEMNLTPKPTVVEFDLRQAIINDAILNRPYQD